MADQYAYPFDPTGQLASNRIVDEPIIITSPGSRLFHWTMPKFCPFFEEGATLKLRDLEGNIIPLTNKVDYYFSHKFMEASLATMHPVWGSITFLRRDIVGTLLFSYNTIGGEWTVDSQKIAELMLNTSVNPRITTWEQVVDRPREFPVIDHPWNLVDMVGMKDVVDVLERFLQAYLSSLDPDGGGGSGALYDHINNKRNPHQVTADQVDAFTKAQITSMLNAYRLKTDPVEDSQRLGGQTLGQVLAAAANQTVLNAERFAGYTFAEATVEILKGTAANSLKLEGRNTQELTAYILQGKVADSFKLDGYTLQEIKDQLQGALGDATTLSGKSLSEIMADVVQTKVDSAVNADKLENRTTAELVTYLTTTLKPAMSQDSEKVYNLDQEGLLNYMQSSLDFNRESAVVGELLGAADSLAANVPVYINPLVMTDGELYSTYIQVLEHSITGLKQGWLKVTFTEATRAPTVSIANGDFVDADFNFGWTRATEAGEDTIRFWLMLKNVFNAVTVNIYNQYSPLVFNEDADWQTNAPAGVTWGTRVTSGDLAQTEAAFNELAAHIETLIEEPAVPVTP